jgi:hypothetical protein
MNPKTKMYYNGKEINWRNQYAKISAITKLKRLLKKIIRLAIYSALLLSFITSIVAITYFMNTREVIKEVEVIQQVDNLSPKIEQLKAEVLVDLKSCESGGYKESDGLIIFDSNKVASIGLYQFQKKTVIHYYKTIYNKTITGKEAIEISLDDELSTELASDIIFKTAGISNWHNCDVKKGLTNKINFINKISK